LFPTALVFIVCYYMLLTKVRRRCR